MLLLEICYGLRSIMIKMFPVFPFLIEPFLIVKMVDHLIDQRLVVLIAVSLVFLAWFGSEDVVLGEVSLKRIVMGMFFHFLGLLLLGHILFLFINLSSTQNWQAENFGID